MCPAKEAKTGTIGDCDASVVGYPLLTRSSLQPWDWLTWRKERWFVSSALRLSFPLNFCEMRTSTSLHNWWDIINVSDWHLVGQTACTMNLAWNSNTVDNERLLSNHANTPGFLGPGGEEFKPGPETRLDRSELLCNKVLLKYKGDRESFWHRHQKRAERVPPW